MTEEQKQKFLNQFTYVVLKLHKDRHPRNKEISVMRFDSVVRCRAILDEDNKKEWDNDPCRFTTWVTPEVPELKNQIYYETKNLEAKEGIDEGPRFASGVLDIPRNLR